MSIEEAVLEKLRELPPDEQRKVLEFVESISKGAEPPQRSVEGLWAGMGFDVTDEDISEARREMWGNFPREDLFR